jgi:hypothetical protein
MGRLSCGWECSFPESPACSLVHSGQRHLGLPKTFLGYKVSSSVPQAFCSEQRQRWVLRVPGPLPPCLSPYPPTQSSPGSGSGGGLRRDGVAWDLVSQCHHIADDMCDRVRCPPKREFLLISTFWLCFGSLGLNLRSPAC